MGDLVAHRGHERNIVDLENTSLDGRKEFAGANHFPINGSPFFSLLGNKELGTTFLLSKFTAVDPTPLIIFIVRVLGGTPAAGTGIEIKEKG